MSVEQSMGIYRKIWSCAIHGKRINAITPLAELCFWRAHMVADDFGVFPGDPHLFMCASMPKRFTELSIDDVADALAELEAMKLIKRYKSNDESMAMIQDFILYQPAGRNGRRVSRFPLPDDWGNPDQSKAIQNNADDSGKTQFHQDQDQDQDQDHIHEQVQDQEHDQVTEPESAKADGDAGAISFDVGGGGPLAGEMERFAKRFDRQDLDRQFAVQSKLAACGVSGNVCRELYSRRDITVELIDRFWQKIKQDKNVGDPAAVLIHRLRKRNNKEHQ